MSDEFDRGFKECEEAHLIPLQSRLQELLVVYAQKGIPFGVYNELKDMLTQSDFRKHWKVTL